MATFGKADADLPLLTWAYQVNEADESEMIALIERAIGTTFPSLDVHARQTEIAEVAQLIPFVRKVMNDLYEFGGLEVYDVSDAGPEDDWDRLNDIFKTYLEHRSAIYYTQPRRGQESSVQTPDGRVIVHAASTKRIAEALDQPSKECNFQIAEALDHLIQAVAADESPLTRCAECQSVFVSNRRGQTFCSHRCAHRAGMRRRRHSTVKKNLAQTTP